MDTRHPHQSETAHGSRVAVEALVSQALSIIADGEMITQKFEALKSQLAAQFPEDRNTLDVILGMYSFVTRQEEIERANRENHRPPKEWYLEVVRFNTDLKHFVLERSAEESRGELELMWNLLKQLDSSSGAVRSEGIARGIIGEVAVHHIFEQLGMNPQDATPDQDALSSIDLWVDAGTRAAVQVKRKKGVLNSGVYRVDDDILEFPGVQPQSGTHTGNIYTVLSDMQRFAVKKKAYEEKYNHGEEIQAFVIALPEDGIDPVNGVPDAKIVASIQKQLEVA